MKFQKKKARKIPHYSKAYREELYNETMVICAKQIKDGKSPDMVLSAFNVSANPVKK